MSDSENGERGGPSTAETVVIAASVAFTVSLFAFAAWQMVTVHPADTPTVEVVDRQTMENGDVVVVVELTNQQDAGIDSVTVESRCTSPPPTLEFTNVPSDGTRYGRIVCPPGTENPEVSLTAWRER